ncbi:MAG TPA: hypothetical protein VM778_04250 [Gemmatimonadota bacterium]|nr:hypothetical protein [Gemmatimonadota bacterium]
MRLRTDAALVLLVVGGTSALSAQERPTSRFTGLQQAEAPAPLQALTPSAEEQPELMVVYGLLLGGVGLIAGAFAGYTLESALCDPCHEFSGVSGGILGATVGESLGLAGGVHLGNQRGGSLGLDILVATAVGTAGVLAAVSSELGFVIFLTPVAQLMATSAVETHHR